MRVSKLWRYPVKSLRGESLDEALVTELGIERDRLVQALRPGGRVFTARTHPRMLGLQGGLDAGGEPTIDGVPWDDPAALAAVRGVTEPDAELVRYDGGGPNASTCCRSRSRPTEASPRSASIAAASARTSTSSGVPGLAEREWVGREVQIGDALLGVRQVRGRCVMTTFDPDTLEQDIAVLQKIYWELGGRTALDCHVLRPGLVRVGDAAEVGESWTLPRSA